MRELDAEVVKVGEDSKHEIETLKTYVKDVRARFNVYIPNKTDSIDAKLGQYLNNYPDKRKLKFTFMRQNQGTYVFGSLLVHVRVDGQSIHVKADGVSIQIGEFIDNVTPLELQKVESRDPIKRLVGGDNGDQS